MNQQINEAKKEYFEPMHTAEHILNQTMVRMFGCPRSKNAHIERKKSKCDYILERSPSEEEVTLIEQKVNEIISNNLDVTEHFMTKEQASEIVDLSKLPDEVSETLRIIRVGDYDACACIGSHVNNTSEIGKFTIISHDYNGNIWRVRFKAGRN